MFVLRFFVHEMQYHIFCSSAECDQCHTLFSAVSCCLVLTGSETSFLQFFFTFFCHWPHQGSS